MRGKTWYLGPVVNWGGYQVAVVSYFDRSLSSIPGAEEYLTAVGKACVARCLKALIASGSKPPAIIIFHAEENQLTASLICPEANIFELEKDSRTCRDALKHPALGRPVKVEALTERAKPPEGTEEERHAYEEDALLIEQWRSVWGAEAQRHPGGNTD